MNPERFNEFFSRITKVLTIDTIAKNIKPIGYALNVEDNLPIFDALELLEKNTSLITKNGLVVTKQQIMSKPVKTLFYALIIEIEYRVYKALKPYVKSIKELQIKNFNEMIREFFSIPDLFKKQNIYTKKQDMKNDLKAVSSFRNIIMHSNRKMDLDVEFKTILDRKRQMFKLLEALGQMYNKY